MIIPDYIAIGILAVCLIMLAVLWELARRQSGVEQDYENPKDYDNNRHSNDGGDDLIPDHSAESELERERRKLGDGFT
jgi:hypothetical protein